MSSSSGKHSYYIIKQLMYKSLVLADIQQKVPCHVIAKAEPLKQYASNKKQTHFCKYKNQKTVNPTGLTLLFTMYQDYITLHMSVDPLVRLSIIVKLV